MAIYAPPADDVAGFVPTTARTYAWIVFGLTFGLLLSDYMSRQVLNAVFPLLKAQWGLSDTQLGALSGVVALLTGLLTFPLSLIADRWGRVRSVVVMASLWSLATLICALASNYSQMFGARFLVGVGEAAYGSVGVALVLSMFPPSLRSTLTGSFMAGGALGSVLGMVFGGALAVRFGWRWSFGGMAAFGFLLVIAYLLVVRESRIGQRRPGDAPRAQAGLASMVKELFSTPSVICAYAGSGLQLFIMSSLIAWLPSYFNRYAGLRTDKAAAAAGLMVLVGAAGMVLCGIATDRLCQHQVARKWRLAMGYSLACAAILLLAFRLPPGPLQLVLLGCGMFFAAATSGPAGAMVANLTPVALHATAFATLTIANNLLGLAPGPFVTGMLADHMGLLGALHWIPLMPVAAALVFRLGLRFYDADLAHIAAMRAAAKA